MEALSYSISMILFALIVGETMVTMRARQAVRGSRERYVALTKRRILSWSVNIGFIVQGLIGIVSGQTFAGLSLLMGLYLSWQEIRSHKDDDDWFNGRMKKIWGGLKKRLAALSRPPVPVRIPAPSPVFG